MADLIYAIADRTLAGTVDGVSFNFYALAGGRATTIQSGAENRKLINNPYATDVKYPDNSEGGPLPCGDYTLEPVGHLRKDRKWIPWIKLVPNPSNHMARRGGFAIHPPGGEGSQGCIVPIADMHRLHAAVASATFNGRKVTLKVIAGDIQDRA